MICRKLCRGTKARPEKWRKWWSVQPGGGLRQPAVVHPVARTHPVTGRKCLYVSKGECEAIEGMPKNEALALIDELADLIVEERFRYTHRWKR